MTIHKCEIHKKAMVTEKELTVNTQSKQLWHIDYISHAKCSLCVTAVYSLFRSYSPETFVSQIFHCRQSELLIMLINMTFYLQPT